MYKYIVRPGFGGKKLLIEFSPKKADEIFLGHLLGALEELNVTIIDVLLRTNSNFEKEYVDFKKYRLPVT